MIKFYTVKSEERKEIESEYLEKFQTKDYSLFEKYLAESKEEIVKLPNEGIIEVYEVD